VPILKTARGDLNYEVVLKYGGKMPPPGGLGNVRFPLVRTVNSFPRGKNVGIERSLVELWVPETCQWLDFRGTMHPVQEEADVQAALLGSQTRQAQRLLETTRQGNAYEKARAAYNWKIMKPKMEREQEAAGRVARNPALANELTVNGGTVLELDKEVQLQQLDQGRKPQGAAQVEVNDNRGRLNDLYEKQTIVNGTGNLTLSGNNNFTGGTNINGGNNTYSGGTNVNGGLIVAQPPASAPQASLVNSGWFAGNGLGTAASAEPLRDLPLKTRAEETQTGRLMFGVGVNSDAGLVGSVSVYGTPAPPLGEPNFTTNGTPAPPLGAPNFTTSGQTGFAGANHDGMRSGGALQLGATTVTGTGGTLSVNPPNVTIAAGNIANLNAQPAAPQVSLGDVSGYAAALAGDHGGSGNQNDEKGAVLRYQQKLNAQSAMQRGEGRQPLLAGKGVEFNRIAGPLPATTEPAPVAPPPETAPPPPDAKPQPGGWVYTVAKPQAEKPACCVPPTAAAVAPAGMASLDFELPQRGRLYRFTTPRGEVELSARAVSTRFLVRLGSLLAIVVLVLAVHRLVLAARRGGFARLRGRPGAILLAVLGLLSLVTGVMPLAGLACLAVGVVRYLMLRRRRAVAA
jgi:autotransporter-associated beta strand protein